MVKVMSSQKMTDGCKTGATRGEDRQSVVDKWWAGRNWCINYIPRNDKRKKEKANE